MAFDRNKYREQLLQRTKETMEQSDYGSSNRYLVSDIPFSLWSWQPTKGTPHLIDIIPFVAGDNFPLDIDRRGKVNPGDPVYVMRIQAHRDIGPNHGWVVCPSKNYDLPCPICEYIDAEIRKGKIYKDFDKIGIKQRCCYYIICYDTPEQEKKGLQILEASYEFTQKMIKPLGKKARTNETISFADPDIGKSISFDIGNDEMKKPFGFQTVDRDYTIDDEILQKAEEYPLDNFLIKRTYDEIRDLFYGGLKTVETTAPADSSENPDNYTPSRMRNKPAEETKPDTDEKVCPSQLGVFGKPGMIDDCMECVLSEACEAEQEARKKATPARRRS